MSSSRLVKSIRSRTNSHRTHSRCDVFVISKSSNMLAHMISEQIWGTTICLVGFGAEDFTLNGDDTSEKNHIMWWLHWNETDEISLFFRTIKNCPACMIIIHIMHYTYHACAATMRKHCGYHYQSLLNWVCSWFGFDEMPFPRANLHTAKDYWPLRLVRRNKQYNQNYVFA